MNEYGKVKKAVVGWPTTISRRARPNDWLFDERPNQFRWRTEATLLLGRYKRLGIDVSLIRVPAKYPNMVFARDLFFRVSPRIIFAASPVGIRHHEARMLGAHLDSLGHFVFKPFSGDGRFEGADALWLGDDALAVGVGHRTNELGYKQLLHHLPPAVGVVKIPLGDDNLGLHLLGHVNIVGPGLAVVRGSAPKQLRSLLDDLAFEVVVCDEVWAQHGAMNFVTVEPFKVVGPQPSRDDRLVSSHWMDAWVGVMRSLDVKYIATPISQYLRAGGGMACATGILEREG